MNFDQLLKFGVEQGASDLHLQAGSAPHVRIKGQIRSVDAAPVEAEDLRQFIAAIAPGVGAEGLGPALVRGLNFSHAVEGLSRFRCNAYSQLGQPGLSLRLIRPTIPTLEELNLPTAIRDVALARRGLVLIAGTAGSGKTTTLAAIVDLINGSHSGKVVTIEDPVEFRHVPKRALLAHLEVGRDTPSFAQGLQEALRQDPDVIVLGDLGDAETMQMVLRAADTGSQVLATIRSANAIQAVERLLAMVPAAEQAIARSQLGNALVAVVAQRLAVTRDGSRRPAIEILRGGPVFARSIQENRLGDLASYMSYREGGMQRFDQHLLDLYQAGIVSGTEALRLATDPVALATDLRSSKPRAGAG